jgi:hypothetical protein
MRDVDMVVSKPIHPHLMKKERADTGCILHLQIPKNLDDLEGHFLQVPIVAATTWHYHVYADAKRSASGGLIVQK